MLTEFIDNANNHVVLRNYREENRETSLYWKSF